MKFLLRCRRVSVSSVLKEKTAPCARLDRFIRLIAKILFAWSYTDVNGAYKQPQRTRVLALLFKGKQHLHYHSNENHANLVDCMARSPCLTH